VNEYYIIGGIFVRGGGVVLFPLFTYKIYTEQQLTCTTMFVRVRVMVFNATFNNISVRL
jgi:hypothetical protein